MPAGVPAGVTVRSATTEDVPGIRELVDTYAPDRRLLGKATGQLYEDLPEFLVAVGDAGQIVGCGALHVMWADLAEVRTIAVAPAQAGRGIGSLLLAGLIDRAREFHVRRVFCLTFETGFFHRHGFVEFSGPGVSPEVYTELLQSEDEGVAEFLELERVRPNTLGNHRMILRIV